MPKGVLKRINQLCSSFFWHGKEQTVNGARVRWEVICFSKYERDLGLKNLVSWNKACILQNIWAIIIKVGSLWIAWI